MKQRLICGVVLLGMLGASGAALAARHHYDVIGEYYGRSVEEAIDNAWRDADEQCYRNWGRSDQDITVLETGVDPSTGYFTARVSLGCTVDD